MTTNAAGNTIDPIAVTGGGGGGGGGNVSVVSPLGPTTAPAVAVATTDTGTPVTGVTMPTGGQGLSGWLSGIYNKVGVASSVAISGPLGPSTANTAALAITDTGAPPTGVTIPSGGQGIIGWLGAIFNKLSGSIAVTGAFFQATQPVSAVSLPLPTGAATAANQNVTAAGSSATNAQGVQGVTGGVAVPVSAASLPLPTGAATAALQGTGNTSTALIASNQNVTAAGVSASNAQAVQGLTGGVAMPVSATALPLPTGAATSALQTTGNASLASVVTNQNATAAGTTATSAQAVQGVAGGVAMPVSASALPLPTGAATAANQATEITSLGTIATAQGTSATGVTFPTGAAGVLGWLSSIYNKLNTSIAIYPVQTTSTSRNGTITTGGTAQTLMAANASRKGWSVGYVSAPMWVTDDGSTASAINGYPVAPGQILDDGGKVSGSALSIYCATTSASFSAREYA